MTTQLRYSMTKRLRRGGKREDKDSDTEEETDSKMAAKASSSTYSPATFFGASMMLAVWVMRGLMFVGFFYSVYYTVSTNLTRYSDLRKAQDMRQRRQQVTTEAAATTKTHPSSAFTDLHQLSEKQRQRQLVADPKKTPAKTSKKKKKKEAEEATKAPTTKKYPGEYNSETNEYIMWSNEEAYFHECRTSFMHNETWAKPLGPLVEKVEAKEIARRWSDSVSIIPTLAVYDASNISDLTLGAMLDNRTLPQPYIIKSGHRSGGVAIVRNNTYKCFKGCGKASLGDYAKGKPGFGKYAEPVAINGKIANLARQMAADELNRTYGIRQGELQYRDIARNIIIEEALDMTKTMDVTHFYVSNGIPMFAGMECISKATVHQEDRKRVIFSPNFGPLPLKIRAPPCNSLRLKKPKTWDLMHQVVKELGSHLKGYVVRIDLYAAEDKVYFSEFTFASGECKSTMNFHPRVADGLMYAVLRGQMPASAATPEFIEKTIRNKSWVLLLPDSKAGSRGGGGQYQTRFFPSPVDLCESDGYDDEVFNTTSSKDACYEAAREVKTSPLRCFLLQEGGDSASAVPNDSGVYGRTVRSAGALSYSEIDQMKNRNSCMEALGLAGQEQE